MKKLLDVYAPPPRHWVGDGFPVRSLFSYDRMGAERISPFLLLDYAGPQDFAPANTPRGVGAHPHRGFETVTIVYDGEVRHRDSGGGGGTIGKGDVQWMTAGKGIVHEEFHSESFTRSGGRFEVVQLWVNLGAGNKLAPAAYQPIRAADIPAVPLPDAAGSVQVIAGAHAGVAGPARTFSPINVWDVRLRRDGVARLEVPDGHTALLVVLSGTVQINGNHILRNAEVALFERRGTDMELEANNDAKLLVLTGEPIDEPVVGYGPFVMNTADEIRQAIDDFQNGRLAEPA